MVLYRRLHPFFVVVTISLGAACARTPSAVAVHKSGPERAIAARADGDTKSSGRDMVEQGATRLRPAAAATPGADAGAKVPSTPADGAAASGDAASVTEPAAAGSTTLRAVAAALGAAQSPTGNVAEQVELPGGLDAHEMAITVLSAPTHLFWFAGATVLTDPGPCVAPSAADANAKACVAAGAGLDATLAQLPQLDAVVLSRNDDAHLDARMARRLWDQYRADFVVPAGAKPRLVRAGVPASHVAERRAWQAVKLAKGRLQASYVPTEVPLKGAAASRDPAMGVVFGSGGHNVLFVAHGQVGHHFQAIRKRFGSPAVSVLSVANPTADGGKDVADALGPREAVLVHRVLDSALAVGTPAGPAADSHPAKGLDRAQALGEAQAVHGVGADCFVSPQPFRTLRVALDQVGPCARPKPAELAPAPAAPQGHR